MNIPLIIAGITETDTASGQRRMGSSGDVVIDVVVIVAVTFVLIVLIKWLRSYLQTRGSSDD